MKAKLKKPLTALMMAWGTYLAIPCPYKVWDDALRPWQIVCLPPVGLIVGGLWALCAALFAHFRFTGFLAAAILTALPFLVTGFFHLDGFLDCCDAILSRRDLVTRQKILKDSRVGAFAVVCAILLFLFSFAALADCDFSYIWRALLLVPVVTRCMAGVAVESFAPMKTSQYSGTFAAGKTRRQRNILLGMYLAVMLAVCLVVVYVALTYLVTRPLGKIRSGVDEVSEGNLDVRLSYSESSQEMSSLTTAFNDMAHELADVYAGLEDEVADRTAQLQQANEVLEQQRRQLEAVNAQLVDENQYKSDFLSMVSHELRTPLTSIVAFADLLSKHRAGADENEAKALAGIEANSQALMLMINDILEMSRLDAGRVKLSLEVVDVGDVVGIVRATVGPLAAKEHLEFTNEVAPDVPLVQGDFDKLVHVLQNLCGNAVKFTPDGGTVHLGAAFHPASSKDAVDEVWLTVADSGIGIDAADQERIFEKFVQVDSSSTRRYNGTGLGLAIVREYAEMHGGSVSVESELGQGASFVVRIPVSGPVSRETAEKDEKSGSGPSGEDLPKGEQS